MGPLLQKINSPADLRQLSQRELELVAVELREYILEVISENGGHLGAALGAVELTLGLHRVFKMPEDTIVWDVGHQVHAHKILTGRRDAFRSFRLEGGLSGFSNKDESPYDPFTTGHGGASISTALGLAVGNRILGKPRKVIAVIGDASLVSGMAFEGLNHAGHLKDDLVVILNDNEMSISPTVGALSKHLNRIITNPFYNHLRKDLVELVRKMPKVGDRMVSYAKRVDEGLKNLLVPGLIFEELGFRYFGPLDGHDLKGLIKTFENIKKIKGPILLHVVTKKGKGYAIAEKNPERWHASTPFHILTGEVKKVSTVKTYTQAAGRAIVDLAAKDPRVTAITAAMCEGTGLVEFSKKFPERFFDVGIAEEHGVSFASGLAKKGLRPIVAIYSTFLQRAHDQIIHDVALQNSTVIFAMDRAGLVGEDGPTHHGIFDIAYLRKVPGMTVMAPRDARELDKMLAFAVAHTEGPIAVRYPRGAVAEESASPLKELAPAAVEKGRAEVIRHGNDAVIFALGSMVYPAYEAAQLLEKQGIQVTVVNARFAKPLDEAAILNLSKDKPLILTLEEGSLAGGFGEAVLEVVERVKSQTGLLKNLTVRTLGIPDRFIDHGKRESLLDSIDLSPRKIAAQVVSALDIIRLTDTPQARAAVNYGKTSL